MLGPATQQLNGVGVAVDEQTQQLIEGVHGGVRVIVYHLLKATHTQQISFTVQATAPDIDVGALHVGAIGIAAAIGEEDDILSQARVGLQKIAFWSIEKAQSSHLPFFDLFLNHSLLDEDCQVKNAKRIGTHWIARGTGILRLNFFQRLSAVDLRFILEMGVQVSRRFQRTVPQPLLNLDQRRPILNQQRGTGMA